MSKSETLAPSQPTEVSLEEKHEVALQNPEAQWYLAYGSNLSSAVFTGKRNIQPLAKRNVLVYGLEMELDLGGIPYQEPRFANCRVVPIPPRESREVHVAETKQPDRGTCRMESARTSHMDAWDDRCGQLIGVAYLLTPKDFARVLATEGGGAAYTMISIDAYILSRARSIGDAITLTGTKLKVSTLQAPKSQERPHIRGQASKRYLDLLRSGAKENKLPELYIRYLYSLPHFELTSAQQRLGAKTFLAIWRPQFMYAYVLQSLHHDKNGSAPKWIQLLFTIVYRGMWASYDLVWKPLFGDGEVTQPV